MLVTVADEAGRVASLDVTADMEVENFKALVEAEFHRAAPTFGLFLLSGAELVDAAKSLSSYGVGPNAFVFLRAKQGASVTSSPTAVTRVQPAASMPAPAAGDPISALTNWARNLQIPTSISGARRPVPTEPDYAAIRERFLPDLAVLTHHFPQLAEAVRSNDLAAIKRIMEEQNKRKREAEEQERKYRQRLIDNPYDLEAQKALEERIRMENVEANYQNALEFHPEAFGSVHMLYITCEVNGAPVKAFVDSGAQVTIMSTQCAERCGIMRLVDTRFGGMARGVGQAKILGRVHAAQVKIGGGHFACSFNVMDNPQPEMLLGLDMLKRHQCCIDLANNVLRVGSGDIVTPFLAEGEIPREFVSPETPNPDASLQPASDQPTSSTNQAAASSSSNSTYSEVDIANLILVSGASREMVIQALNLANGNVDAAAQILL